MTWSFVILSYVLTLGGTLALVVATARRARRLADEVPPEDRPWT